jgi:hypothetical protein
MFKIPLQNYSMEHVAVCPVQQKYFLRFVATFLPENKVKSFKIDFEKTVDVVRSLIFLKSGYLPDSEDIYDVFERLRYKISSADTIFDDTYLSESKMYLNISVVQVECMASLLNHLTKNTLAVSDKRIQELNLQIDIFNKLHAVKKKTA